MNGILNEKYIDAIPVNIDRSVHWRSWTYKTIKNAQVGQWYVVLRDEVNKSCIRYCHFSQLLMND